MEFYSLVSLPYVDKEPALGLNLYLLPQLSKKAQWQVSGISFLSSALAGRYIKSRSDFMNGI
ncbi:MAG: hypothetical protein HQ551_07200 [Desulfobacteraceae bacterium]|nr:hypothetical protein [Desulfobacteraceae bacterium]